MNKKVLVGTVVTVIAVGVGVALVSEPATTAKATIPSQEIEVAEVAEVEYNSGTGGQYDLAKEIEEYEAGIDMTEGYDSAMDSNHPNFDPSIIADGTDQDAEEVYYETETVNTFQPFTNKPIRVWGSDLGNKLATYPQEYTAKYGDKLLLLSGHVTNSYSNGVDLGLLFVPNVHAPKGTVIEVICYGAVATGGYPSSVANDCS